MNLVDANVLIYAVNTDAHHHRAAKTWLDRALSGGSTVGFCWPVILAFVRLVTKQGLFPTPLSPGTAIEIVDEWLAQPAARLVSPTARHLDVWSRLLAEAGGRDGGGAGGNLVNDAHLAGLATEQRAEVVTFDRDFDRFAPVRWSVPGA